MSETARSFNCGHENGVESFIRATKRGLFATKLEYEQCIREAARYKVCYMFPRGPEQRDCVLERIYIHREINL